MGSKKDRYPDVGGKLPEEFTGLCFSVVCSRTNGVWRNFKIVSLQLKDGMVESLTKTDPYASFDCQARLEKIIHERLIHLNNTWKDGKTLE